MEWSTAQRIFGSDTVTTVMDVESDLLSYSTGGRIDNRQDCLTVSMSVTSLHPQKIKSPVRLLYLDHGSCIGSRRTAVSIMQVPK